MSGHRVRVLLATICTALALPYLVPAFNVTADPSPPRTCEYQAPTDISGGI